MKINVITKVNKVLNVTSAICLFVGIMLVIWTICITSELWALFLVTIISIGFLTLLISWLYKKCVIIDITKIVELSINPISEIKVIEEINKETDLEYIGNWLHLTNGNKFEINNKVALKLLFKIDEKKIRIKRFENSVYNISPKEIVEMILTFEA